MLRCCLRRAIAAIFAITHTIAYAIYIMPHDTLFIIALLFLRFSLQMPLIFSCRR